MLEDIESIIKAIREEFDALAHTGQGNSDKGTVKF